MTVKAARPETLSQARTWERIKNRYIAHGCCHACASQLAYGHQLGFSALLEQPCKADSALVATLPKPQVNGWHSLRAPLSQRGDLMRTSGEVDSLAPEALGFAQTGHAMPASATATAP